MKLGVRSNLAAFLSDKRIARAVEHLDRSLAPDLWAGDSHLTKKGQKVFDEEKKAVEELQKVRSGPAAAAVVVAIASLVNADAALAQTAIDEAPAGKEKTAALDDMAKAADEITRGNPDRAIEYYKHVWEHATRA